MKLQLKEDINEQIPAERRIFVVIILDGKVQGPWQVVENGIDQYVATPWGTIPIEDCKIIEIKASK